MKDYYYFLGIPQDASTEDIRKAYHKLSLKYHPDKNENDVFFEKRFLEVQEAYEVLSDTEKRRLFDRQYQNALQKVVSSLPPVIKSFHVNKTRAMKGEEIIVTWQTNNADVVKVLPFGLVSEYGEKTFKITEFKDGKFHVVLHANNSLLNKTVVQGFTITQIFENDKEKLKNDLEDLFKTQERTPSNPSGSPKIFRYILAVAVALMLIYLLIKIR